MPIDLRQIIAECALSELPADAQTELINLVRDQLQTVVGAVLIDLMPRDAHDAFQRLHDAGDHDGAFHVLIGAIPHYDVIVAQQFDRLVAAVADQADEIRRATLPLQRRTALLERAAALLRHLQATRARAYEPEPEDLPFGPLYATRFSSIQTGRAVQQMLDRAQTGEVITIWAHTFDQQEMATAHVNLSIEAPGRSRTLTSGARLYSTRTVDGVAADILTPTGSTSSTSSAVIFLAPMRAVGSELPCADSSA